MPSDDFGKGYAQAVRDILTLLEVNGEDLDEVRQGTEQEAF